MSDALAQFARTLPGTVLVVVSTTPKTPSGAPPSESPRIDRTTVAVRSHTPTGRVAANRSSRVNRQLMTVRRRIGSVSTVSIECGFVPDGRAETGSLTPFVSCYSVADGNGVVIAEALFDVVNPSFRYFDSDARSFGVGNLPEGSPDTADESADGDADTEPEGDEREAAGGHDRAQPWEPDRVHGHRQQDRRADDATDEPAPQQPTCLRRVRRWVEEGILDVWALGVETILA